MICWRWLLVLMAVTFAAGVVVGAAYPRELRELVWRVAP